MKRALVLGTEIDRISFAGAIEHASTCMARRDGAYVVTPNAEIILNARNDCALQTALRAAAISLPDGVGAMLAARILGAPICERIAGIDFAQALLAYLNTQKGSVFLLGARDGVALRAAEALSGRYPSLIVAGAENGFFREEQEEELIAKINAVSPDLLLVCLGTPKQELWMYRHAPHLKVGLMAGLGGALDVFSGDLKRAPKAWRDRGLEWLFRLLQEPGRLRRVLRLPHIILLALYYRIGGDTRQCQTES